MAGYLAGDADVSIAVGAFWIAKLWSVGSPNQNRKYLFWIWHIEVHKRGQTFRLLGKMNASDTSADGCGLAHVIFCFCRSQMMLGLCVRDVARRHAKHQHESSSESSHNDLDTGRVKVLSLRKDA